MPSSNVTSLSTVVAADVKAAEKTVSAWRLNGWAALLLMAVANAVGVFFHI